MSNLAILYGKRVFHGIICLQKIIYELKKNMKLLELIFIKKGMIYFINSYVGFNFILKNSMKQFFITLVKNKRKKKRLFLSNTKYLKYSKIILKRKRLRKKGFFLIKPNICLLGKWFGGFLTNNFIFRKKLKHKAPRLPHFGVIMDHNINEIPSAEFKKVTIPYSSLLDIIDFKFSKVFYGIPSNGKSLNCIGFYLSTTLNAYYNGVIMELNFFHTNIN